MSGRPNGEGTMSAIELVEKSQMADRPRMKSGDTVREHVKVREGEKERNQSVDEVGRGCLAGPVVAAAVVLDPERYIPGIHDSKMVSALERERLYGVITRKALAWSVASAQPAEIDDINIHRASLEAMRRAVMT